MKIESLQDLYLEQLQDLYNAEEQLIKALPKMAKAASSAELKAAFEDHLEQTREHALRIESICEQMGKKADGKKCKAMEGLIKEGAETIRVPRSGGSSFEGIGMRAPTQYRPFAGSSKRSMRSRAPTRPTALRWNPTNTRTTRSSLVTVPGTRLPSSSRAARCS